MLQDIEQEVIVVDTQCQSIVNQIIETRVFSAVGADTTLLGHDIAAEGDSISCVFLVDSLHYPKTGLKRGTELCRMKNGKQREKEEEGKRENVLLVFNKDAIWARSASERIQRYPISVSRWRISDGGGAIVAAVMAILNLPYFAFGLG